MAWTGEPAYSDPGPDLRAAAAGWRSLIEAEHLRELVRSMPGPRSRLHAPEAMAAADAFILDGWRSAGWMVERQALHLENVEGVLDYPRNNGRGKPRKSAHVYTRLDGVNLVGVLPGETREAIVLVAHHDTVRDSPGADDNGAAVAALLEVSRLLAGRSFHRSVLLAAPDFEELGLIGSRHLVPWLKQRYRLRGAIVFDAIGYMDHTPHSQSVPPGLEWLYPRQAARMRARNYAGDTVVAVYRDASRRLVRAWARCLAAAIGSDRVLVLRDPADLPLVGRVARIVPSVRNFSRSDHVNFWRAGVPAIQVSDTGNFRNPNYHRPSDTPDTLDYDSLAGIVAATALLVERLAGEPTSARVAATEGTVP
jgi:hypothetical protein